MIEYQIQILESHLDTFGHVNNATYLELFEQARWEYITKNGYGLNEILDLKIGPVILEAHIRYRKELNLREKIKIVSEFNDLDSKVFSIHQKLFNEEGELSAEANFKSGLMDLKSRKLIRPTEKWQKALGK